MSLVTALESEYKDLDLSLKAHPERGDVVSLKDVAAIKNSIKIILNTRLGEKPFNPDFGCNLFAFLFEPDDIITRTAIRKSIQDSINRFEPRFRITEVLVDSNSDNNAYNITISGVIVNSQRNIDVNFLIKRFS